MSIYVLIMAGGVGSRLWPRSRKANPKQFLPLLDEVTMLQEAQRRIAPMVPLENTLIATSVEYVPVVKAQLPDIPSRNILPEPVMRGTAAAIGLAAFTIKSRDPDAVMIVLTADHLIGRVDAFRSSLTAAVEVAQDNYLVTLGIRPNGPETGYGYIRQGNHIGGFNGWDAYSVDQFVEKPNSETAQYLLTAGGYTWNSGMFIWRVDRFLAEMSVQMPALYAGLKDIEEARTTSYFNTVLTSEFPKLPYATIDYGIMEHASRVAVIPVEIGWNDIGSWSAVHAVSPHTDEGNAITGDVFALDVKNSLIYAKEKFIAAIGVEDLIIIDTGDALLVCPKDRAQEVKAVIKYLKETERNSLL